VPIKGRVGNKARFIAGATCPRCDLLDKLVLKRDLAVNQRSCVSCGYVEELPREVEGRTGSLPGASVQPLKIIDDI